jgi:hypothetical protein
MKVLKETSNSLVTPQNNSLLLSVFSYLNDYHLCWEINQIFDINLVRYDDFSFVDHATGTKSFSVYGYESEIDKRHFILIANKSFNGPLVVELPKVDYFFWVSGYVDAQDEQLFSQRIKNIQCVLTTINTYNNGLSAKCKRSLKEVFTHFE